VALSSTVGKRPRIPVIRYEDDWVCVNKPPALSVHASRRSEVTLRSMLKRQLARKVFPVHRLDHRTSGAILFAFDSETCGAIHERLVNGQKDYIALVRGEWKYEEQPVVMDDPLNVDGIMKDAVTEFTLIARSNYQDMPCSLLLCQPKTGRTHQIRRHAHRLGHPIIGDTQHGDSRVNRQWRAERGLNRLALHCMTIQLQNDEIPYTAPVSNEFRAALEQDEIMWQTIISSDPRFLLNPIDEKGGSFGRHYRERLDADIPAET